MDIAVSQFFKLLGWATSSGDKDLPFDVKFKALGVEVDLSECRVAKHLSEILLRGSMSL